MQEERIVEVLGSDTESTEVGASWLEFESSFGAPFDAPWGLTMTPDGSLAVVERGSAGRPPCLRVISAPATIASDDTDLKSRMLPLPPADSPVDDIQDICCCAAHPPSPPMLLVADVENHCVHRLEWPSGKPMLPSIGSASKSDAEEALHNPRSVAILERPGAAPLAAAGPALPERLVCVADAGNGRVQVFDAGTLAHVRTIGKPASDPYSGVCVHGELEQPLGLEVHNGELYVVDGYMHRISVFDGVRGTFLRAIGGPSELASPFACRVVRGMLVVSEATKLSLYTLDGERRDVVEIPHAHNLAGLCAGDEHVYVSDLTAGVVHRLRIGWADEGDRYSDLDEVR